MRIFAALALALILAGCASSGRPAYLDKDGNSASWGEGKREINTSLADVVTKDDL
jgi:hypothetical protein